jgi:hypothetical protein
MERIELFQTIAAVFVGNVLTAAWLVFLYRTWRVDRDGGDSWKQPVWVFLCGAVPPIFAAVSLWGFLR